MVPFFGGVFLVLMKWPVFGMLLELYGIIRLFGSYFPMIFTMLHQVCFCFVYLIFEDSWYWKPA